MKYTVLRGYEFSLFRLNGHVYSGDFVDGIEHGDGMWNPTPSLRNDEFKVEVRWGEMKKVIDAISRSDDVDDNLISKRLLLNFFLIFPVFNEFSFIMQLFSLLNRQFRRDMLLCKRSHKRISIRQLMKNADC